MNLVEALHDEATDVGLDLVADDAFLLPADLAALCPSDRSRHAGFQLWAPENKTQLLRLQVFHHDEQHRPWCYFYLLVKERVKFFNSQLSTIHSQRYLLSKQKKKYLKGIEPNPIRTDNLQEIPSKLESDALPLRHGSCCY
ncbi:hypothetical protein TRIATDRAFT_93994 [Trichoderma atroviride IMI 206040]|uniref:Uncharacterized protein n=1 Tax=Hypocrea atroviridis (strain ATCC 20476 / IMI 206040) TaxID=452589 RepID=G9NKW8_HYPAI|nr:uncharacterized protein TRIATDRAFT_93994 [Trichoderma atroviride IMI 206040]EHK48538.1 hypothetical protein TRIATDRAFT_93994 [Trichoderma atroviride IMI 206040]